MASPVYQLSYISLSQLPCLRRGGGRWGEAGVDYPRCTTTWPLFDLFHRDAGVWPRAGLGIGHSHPIGRLRRS